MRLVFIVLLSCCGLTLAQISEDENVIETETETLEEEEGLSMQRVIKKIYY